VYPRSPDLSQTLPFSPHVTGGCSRIVGSCPIATPERALSEWDKANPGAVYDRELFRREIVPRLGTVKLSEIAEAAGCSKAFDRQVVLSAAQEADELDHADERQVEERDHHEGASSLPGPWTESPGGSCGWPSRHTHVSIGLATDNAAIASPCARLQDGRTRVTESTAFPCSSERRDRVSAALHLGLDYVSS